MRLDHLLSKENMLVFHALRERTGIFTKSTTDEAIETEGSIAHLARTVRGLSVLRLPQWGSFDKLRMTIASSFAKMHCSALRE